VRVRTFTKERQSRVEKDAKRGERGSGMMMRGIVWRVIDRWAGTV
jgi:hypothetical protein